MTYPQILLYDLSVHFYPNVFDCQSTAINRPYAPSLILFSCYVSSLFCRLITSISLTRFWGSITITGAESGISGIGVKTSNSERVTGLLRLCGTNTFGNGMNASSGFTSFG